MPFVRWHDRPGMEADAPSSTLVAEGVSNGAPAEPVSWSNQLLDRLRAALEREHGNELLSEFEHGF
jgi:hypothetical protein